MKLFLILGVALLAIPACESSEEDGTESHFLEHCTESSQCGELTCIAQSCTRACDSDADCSSLGPSTYCRQEAGVARCGVTGDGEAGANAGGRTTTGGVADAPASGGAGGSDLLGTGGSPEAGRSGGGAGQTGGAAQTGGATSAGASGTDGGATAEAGAVNAPGGEAGTAGSAATDRIACTDSARADGRGRRHGLRPVRTHGSRLRPGRAAVPSRGSSSSERSRMPQPLAASRRERVHEQQLERP